MPFFEYLAIGLMVIFILSLFTGYPVAWLLAGLSLLFAGLGITLGEMGYDTFLMTSWAKFSGVIDRFDSIMSNWVSRKSTCSSSLSRIFSKISRLM